MCNLGVWKQYSILFYLVWTILIHSWVAVSLCILIMKTRNWVSITRVPPLWRKQTALSKAKVSTTAHCGDVQGLSAISGDSSGLESWYPSSKLTGVGLSSDKTRNTLSFHNFIGARGVVKRGAANKNKISMLFKRLQWTKQGDWKPIGLIKACMLLVNRSISYLSFLGPLFTSKYICFIDFV